MRRINPAQVTAAALGFGYNKGLAKSEPFHLPLDLVPTQARHSQDKLVFSE